MRTLIAGISGLSSTGKTTLSRHLRKILPTSFILHQDDFYHPDAQIPTTASGTQDWDCAAAIDWVRLSTVLARTREDGTPPKDLVSLQEESPVGDGRELVLPEFVERMRRRIEEEGLGERTRVAILDGFLLFHEGGCVEEKLDVKMLLRVPYDVAKRRREGREGYVTIDGFWTDPPGYFDEIVWPNYVNEHKDLFGDGDVEGRLKPEVEEKRRIHTPQRLDMTAEETLEWAVDVLIKELGRKAQGTD